MLLRPKAASKVQDSSPWIVRFLSLQPVKLVDQNTKDVTEHNRFAIVARKGIGRAIMHLLVVADQLRICIPEKRSLSSIQRRQTAF